MGPDYHFELTRPGIGLYGGLPFADATPVVRLSLPVIQVARRRTGRDGRLWLQLHRHAADETRHRFRGVRRRAHPRHVGPRAALGRVTRPARSPDACPMDLLTVDVTDLETVPDTLDILGPRQGVDDSGQGRRHDRLRDPHLAGRTLPPARCRGRPRMSGLLTAPLAMVGRSVLGLLGNSGRVAIFFAHVVSHLFRPPLVSARNWRSNCLHIGWALAARRGGLRRCSPAARWRCRSYAGGARFNAEAVVPPDRRHLASRESFGPVLGGLMVAGPRRRRHRRRDRHDEGDRTDRRARDAFDQPAEIPRRAARPGATLFAAGAGGVGDSIGILGGYLVGTTRLGFDAARLYQQHGRFPRDLGHRLGG